MIEMNKFQQILGLAMQKGMRQFGDLLAFLNPHGLNPNNDADFDRIVEVLKAVA